jgi:hypothetical protein
MFNAFSYTTLKSQVADAQHFYADPDPAFRFNADPDPTLHFVAHPDPVPHQSVANLRQLVYRPWLQGSI